MIRHTCLILLCLVTLGSGFAQSDRSPATQKPEVGKPMPEFTLYNVKYYEKSKASLKDFKGKWLFLNFWYRGCTASIKSLQKINAMHEKFRKNAEFVLIGVNSKMAFGDGIAPLYERLRKKQNLKLPIAYDSLLVQRWEIWSHPHIIIIDPKGIVFSITAGSDLTAKKVEDLLNGKAVNFKPKGIKRPPFNPFSKADASTSLIYQSILTHWSGERQSIPRIEDFATNGSVSDIRISMAALPWIYNIAYFGKSSWSMRSDSLYDKVYPLPVLELHDSSMFNFNFINMTGLYNFAIKTPTTRNTPQQVMTAMQTELKNIFGFEASIQERWMQVYNLIVLPGAIEKLKTKGGAPGHVFDTNGDGGAAGFEFNNYPVSHLLDLLMRYSDQNHIPHFDETGIHSNIDIKFDALMTDPEQVLTTLRQNGLDLVLARRRMKVLVIKDAPARIHH